MFSCYPCFVFNTLHCFMLLFVLYSWENKSEQQPGLQEPGLQQPAQLEQERWGRDGKQPGAEEHWQDQEKSIPGCSIFTAFLDQILKSA